MKYISIGNYPCNISLERYEALHEFNIRYPFDDTVVNMAIVNDILSNGWDKYLDINNPQTGLDNDDLIEYRQQYMDLSTETVCAYQSFTSFPGYAFVSLDEMKGEIQYRIDNFMNAINGEEEITFIFANHLADFSKTWRDRQDYHYQKLLEFIEILQTKYNKTNIKVLAFLSNTTLADTEIIKVHSIDMPQDFISDNYEKNYDEASEHYKMMLNEKLEQILGL